MPTTTFVVETGSGSATANSYATVAQANTYHGDNGQSRPWFESSDPEKQEALRLATRWIDAEFSFRGRRTTDTQRLEWPRAWMRRNDFALGSDEIPRELVDATAFVAGEIRRYNDEESTTPDRLLFRPEDRSGDVTRKKIKVGPIEIDKEFAGAASEQVEFPFADQILAPFIFAAGTVLRG